MMFREHMIQYNSTECKGGRKWQEKKYKREIDYGGPYGQVKAHRFYLSRCLKTFGGSKKANMIK